MAGRGWRKVGGGKGRGSSAWCTWLLLAMAVNCAIASCVDVDSLPDLTSSLDPIVRGKDSAIRGTRPNCRYGASGSRPCRKVRRSRSLLRLAAAAAAKPPNTRRRSPTSRPTHKPKPPQSKPKFKLRPKPRPKSPPSRRPPHHRSPSPPKSRPRPKSSKKPPSRPKPSKKPPSRPKPLKKPTSRPRPARTTPSRPKPSKKPPSSPRPSKKPPTRKPPHKRSPPVPSWMLPLVPTRDSEIKPPSVIRPDIRLSAANHKPIKSTFMGLSFEPDNFFELLELNSPVFAKLVSFFTNSSPLIIRIGGNGSDRLPKVALYFTDHRLNLLKKFRALTGCKYIISVPLRYYKLDFAAQQVIRAFVALGEEGIYAFAIGNEPDSYQFGERYVTNTFPIDYLKIASTLTEVLPFKPRFIGPGFTRTNGVGPWMKRFLSTTKGVTSMASAHFYGFYNTNRSVKQDLVRLVSYPISVRPQNWVGPLLGITGSLGLPLRIDELNTASHGGIRNVSNTFAAAIWAFDVMLSFASMGVAGVNWHCSGVRQRDNYSPIYFHPDGLPMFHPIFYSLVAFADVVPPGSRVVPMPPADGTDRMVKFWLVVAPDKTRRLVISNRLYFSSVLVSIPTRSRIAAPAEVRHLDGQSTIDQKVHVSYNRRTWWGSQDGSWKFRRTKLPLALYPNNGVYTIRVPPVHVSIIFLPSIGGLL